MTRRRVLVIQLSRAGDVVMTTPLLRGLRRDDPDAEISLMVMDAFAHVPVPARLSDRRIAMPLKDVAGDLASDRENWRPAFDRLRTFIADVASAPYDLVVNLSHSDVSALLAGLIPARKRGGVTMSSSRRRTIVGPWMTYLRAAVRSREYCGIHLADLFAWTGGVGRDAAGLEMDVSPEAERWFADWARAAGVGARPLVALQLGASAEAKQWPTERFASMVNLVDPAAADFVLVGVAAERALADRFRAATSRPVFDTVGGSSLAELGALLRRCALLVTNDTGPMHVAAAVGTPVVDVSLGPVTPHQTGPYGERHVVIETDLACYPCPIESTCHHMTCRSSVPADVVAGVVRHMLGVGPLPITNGIRLLGAHRERSGRMAFVPIQPARPSEQDVLRQVLADVWERSLGVPAPDETMRHAGQARDHRIDELPSAGHLADVCDAIAAESDAAAAAVRALCAAPAHRRTELADAAHRRLERILALGETDRAIHAFATFIRYEIESCDAVDVAGLASAHAAAYLNGARRARAVAARLRGSGAADISRRRLAG